MALLCGGVVLYSEYAQSIGFEEEGLGAENDSYNNGAYILCSCLLVPRAHITTGPHAGRLTDISVDNTSGDVTVFDVTFKSACCPQNGTVDCERYTSKRPVIPAGRFSDMQQSKWMPVA